MNFYLKNFLVLAFVLKCLAVSAQWVNETRLTNDPNHSWYPTIAASGENIHVAWEEYRDGNQEIYYKRSLNGGANWSSDIRLTNHFEISWFPSITVSSGNIIHLVWQEKRDGNFEIYYKRSTNNGTNWSSDVNLNNAPQDGSWPMITANGDILHLVWSDLRNGYSQIFYKKSTNAGLNWSSDLPISTGTSISHWPAVSAAGSNVYVTWHDYRDGNKEIYFKRSADGGASWGPDVRLTNQFADSENPVVSSQGNNVFIAWMDTRDFNKEIYFKISTDAGLNWQSDLRLTDNSAVSEYPRIAVGSSSIHVIWEDSRDGNKEIYYKTSFDGTTWASDYRLTNNPAASSFSALCVSGANLHVCFEDSRDGNYEIYHKSNPTGNPVGLIQNTESVKNFQLEQNYPNPFNPSTTIKFSVPKEGYTAIKVYDVKGQLVKTLVNQRIIVGSYSVDFNASELSSGVYFYTLEAPDYRQTKRMVLVK